MTEQNTPSAPVEEPTTAVESSQQPAAASRKGKNTGPVLGAIAIVLVIALGAGGYYHTHKQAQQLIAANQALQQQLEGVKQSQQQERNALEGLLQQQGKTDAADREQANLARQLSELQEKVATISGSDAKPGCWRRPISGENGRPQAVERSGRHQRRRAAEKRRRQPGGHERSEPARRAPRHYRRHQHAFYADPCRLRRHHPQGQSAVQSGG